MSKDKKICLGLIGIFIAIIWVSENPTSFLVTLLIISVVFVIHRQLKKKQQEREYKLRLEELEKERKQQEYERKLRLEELEKKKKQQEREHKLRLEEFDSKKNKLISTRNYRFVKSFVKRHVGEIYQFENVAETDKLKDLLTKKGFEFDDEEIKWLIDEEKRIQDYEDFKTKITFNRPKKLENYIRNLIEVYGDDYKEYIGLFKNLLEERNLQFGGEKILDKIEEIEREMELERFEKKLDSEYLYSVSLDDLDIMTGYDFEHFLKLLFEKMGYRVEQTKLSNDQGADLIVSKLGDKIVVQAKRYTKNVNNKAVQEIVASIKHYGADMGMVVTTSEFTNSAIELADSNDIELIDRYKLEKLMREYF